MEIDPLLTISTNQLESFKNFIWEFYILNKRNFPWRTNHDSYAILVSEIMLQQTQTFRAVEKYEQFLSLFPTFSVLAQASFKDVLLAWQGLGYNRRALYLHEIAKKVMQEFNGILPNGSSILETFKGLGKATAASICAFAYNSPTVFIETNIRTVFIFSFFLEEDKVYDKQIIPLIEATLDHNQPREWYYALMDYGVYLKKKIKNSNIKSAHYTKQSKFEGSDRQIRGMILRLLLTHDFCDENFLFENINREPERILRISLELSTDRIIKIENGVYSIVSD